MPQHAVRWFPSATMSLAHELRRADDGPSLVVLISQRKFGMQAANSHLDAGVRQQKTESQQPDCKEEGTADLMCAYIADERKQETAISWAYGQARRRPTSPQGWRWISSAGLQRPATTQHLTRCPLLAQITTPLQQALSP